MKDGQNKNFFKLISSEEYFPYKIEEDESERYFKLNEIFETYYPEKSLDDAKEISMKEREERNLDKDSFFTYGEVTFRAFSFVIEYLKRENLIHEGNFYDLGSGSGKGCLSAALTYPFEKCVGIEYLTELHEFAEKTLKPFGENPEKFLEDNKNLFKGFSKIPKIELFNGDFMNFEWTNTSVILICSTCFNFDFMQKIGKKASKECKKGTVIITFTKGLQGLSSDWDPPIIIRLVMSWGIGTVYLTVRKK